MNLIQQIYKTNDYDCGHNRDKFNNLKSEFSDLKIQYIQADSEEGKKLIEKHEIVVLPGIIVNGEYFVSGRVDEEKLREVLKLSK